MSGSPTLRNRMALWSPPQISVNSLKIIGAVLMVLYFFSACVVQNSILHVSDYTAEELNALMEADSQIMLWAGIGSIGSVIGVMGIPIFAYLLVQGVEHTSSLCRYALSVLVFAVISEVPYDLAVYGRVWDWDSQNTLWAVLIALVTLCLMKYVEGRGVMTYVLSAVAALGGCLWAVLINCKYGWGFVLIASVLFLLREHRTVSLIAGVGVSLVYMTASMGFILISLCNGERTTRDSKLGKYAYYAYYPLILALMALWAWTYQAPRG